MNEIGLMITTIIGVPLLLMVKGMFTSYEPPKGDYPKGGSYGPFDIF